MTRTTHTPARRLALLGAALLTAAAATAGGASAAHADATDGQPYWAEDGCFYLVEGGVWVGSQCVSLMPDGNGGYLPSAYNMHAFDPGAPGNQGQIIFQLDLQDPSWIHFRNPNDPFMYADPSSPGPRWARQSVADPGAPAEIQVFSGGQWHWTQAMKNTTRGGVQSYWTVGPLSGGGWTGGEPTGDTRPAGTVVGGGGSSLTGIPALDTIMIESNKRLLDTWLAPDCNYSSNGCA